MDLHKEVSFDDAREVSLKLAKESAAHAETLAGLAGKGAEPWHKTGSGGFLRNVVYGFNDGLTANFGLVAGVVCAGGQPHVVMISGVAGAEPGGRLRRAPSPPPPQRQQERRVYEE